MSHPVEYDPWEGYEEPEEEDDSPDLDIIELLGDEDEWEDEEEMNEL